MRYTHTQMVRMALVLSIVVSVLTAITTLGITGDLPGQQRAGVSDPPLPSARHSPAWVEQRGDPDREIALERRALTSGYAATLARLAQLATPAEADRGHELALERRALTRGYLAALERLAQQPGTSP
jgi:hypothetical protein